MVDGQLFFLCNLLLEISIEIGELDCAKGLESISSSFKSIQKFHVPFLSKKDKFRFFCTFSFLTYLDRISLSVEEYSVSLIENDSHYISRNSREISERLRFECLDVPICIVCNEHRTLK